MIPGKLDLPTIWRGCDWPAIILTWKDQNGVPFDLTGWFAIAWSRNVNLNASITDPVNGVTQIILDHTQTASLALGEEIWNWIFEYVSTGFVLPPLLSGKLIIKEPVVAHPPAVPPPPATVFEQELALAT